MTTLEILKKTKAAWGSVKSAPAEDKNAILLSMADSIEADTIAILAANAEDMAAAEGTVSDVMLDRLYLDASRVKAMAEGVRAAAALPDHTGRILSKTKHANGMRILKKQVPLGLVAIIYESRPNVTSDAAGLCVKTGNACVLRGGSAALRTNEGIASSLRRALASCSLPEDAVCLLATSDRRATDELMGLTGLVDVLIPRGGAGLIRHCVECAKVPVIETGTGNCHVYVHERADQAMALSIIENSKCQRPGVCNACESLLVDEAIAKAFLPELLRACARWGVLVHADPATMDLARGLGLAREGGCVEALDDDWGREYLSLELSCRVVSGIDEAISHVNRYGTDHSECIVTQDYAAAERFLGQVDAAAVYVNASTRFTDGGMFGLGAEIGISTQKLHARGPMGAEALVSTKWLCRGTGQVRP